MKSFPDYLDRNIKSRTVGEARSSPTSRLETSPPSVTRGGLSARVTKTPGGWFPIIHLYLAHARYSYKKYLLPTKEEETQETKMTGACLLCGKRVGDNTHHSCKLIASSGHSTAIKEFSFFFALWVLATRKSSSWEINPGYPRRMPGAWCTHACALTGELHCSV